METESKDTDRPRKKHRKKGKRGKPGKPRNGKPSQERRPFMQQFGPGMMVEHEVHGIGHVTSAFRQFVNVFFYCESKHENLHHRTLKFTREEQIRRGKIRKAMERGKPVPLACAPETLVVHRLLGFGRVGSVSAEDEKVFVVFDNEYAEKGGQFVEASELRIAPPPPEKKEDDAKKKRRRW